MIDKAVRMKPDQILKKVPGDGNCFTRSVGEHMDLGHTDIRKRIIREVQNNPGEYIDFLPEHELENWSETMKKEGEWCDGLAVKAAANALHVPIVVFRKQSPDQSPSCFLPRDSSPDVDPCCVELDEPGSDQPDYKPTGLEHYNVLLPLHRALKQPAEPVKKRRRKQKSVPAPPASWARNAGIKYKMMGENAVEPPTENKSLCSFVPVEPEALENAALETEALETEKNIGSRSCSPLQCSGRSTQSRFNKCNWRYFK